MSQIMKKDFPDKIICCAFFIMMLSILVVCIFFSGIEYARKVDNSGLGNAIKILLGIVVLGGIKKIVSEIEGLKRNLSSENIVFVFLLIFGAVFLALQVFAVYNYYFFTDWDVKTIVEAAAAQAHGESLEQWEHYFSMYPNNLLLVYSYSVIIKLFIAVGFEAHMYLGILAVQCMLYCGTGWILARVMFSLTHNALMTLASYVIYILLVGISPWVSIPYSDSVALIFPVSILWIYLRIKKNKSNSIHYFLLGAASCVGYRFKPQVIIMTLAIIAVHLTLAVWERKWKIRFIKHIFMGIVGVFCAALLVNAMVGSLKLTIDPEMEYQMPHFFMMGMNTASMGVWDADDVSFSEDIGTVSERNQENIHEAIERINEMGAAGFLKQVIRKTLTNYNDGTFCWGGEGKFYFEVLEEKGAFSKLLRNIYYNRSCQGKYYSIWSDFEQTIWICLLFFSVFAVFGKRDTRICVLMLAIIGLTIFETLFEARARYLFIYAPVYIILGILGMERFYRFFDEKQLRGRSWMKLKKIY